MAKKKRMPRSARKFIRREKARIRRQVFDVKKQEELINQLYNKFNYDNKRDLQPSPPNGSQE